MVEESEAKRREQSAFQKGFQSGLAKKTNLVQEAEATINTFNQSLNVKAEELSDFIMLHLTKNILFSDVTCKEMKRISEEISYFFFEKFHEFVADEKERMQSQKDKAA